MKKSTKILSVIIAVVMLLGIVSSVSFAATDYTRYVTVYGGGTCKGTKSNPWSLMDFMNNIDTINEKISAGDRSAIIINVSSASGTYENTFKLEGIKGNANTPVTIVCNYIDLGEGNNATLEVATGNAIELIDCEYVTIKNINICAASGDGVLVKNCKNVTIENVDSYVKSSSVTKTMEKPIVFEGKNENITITGSDFSCVTEPITIMANDEIAVDNLDIKNIKIEKTLKEAIVVDGVDNIEISDFTVTKAFSLGQEEPEYTTNAAVVIKNSDGVSFRNSKISECYSTAITLDNVINTTVENIYSLDNASFMFNGLGENANVRIRYCVSAYDDYYPIIISATQASGVYLYNNTFYAASAIDMNNLTNSAIANNIYDMQFLGKVMINENNKFATNCYHNTFKNKADSGAMEKNPQFFISVTEKPSLDEFILAAESVLKGTGTRVEENMGTTDIYGNVIDADANINVGAYQGEGIPAIDEVDQSKDSLDFYKNVAGKYIGDFTQKLLDMFFTPEQQETIKATFNYVVSGIVSGITKLIGSFIK